MPAEWEPAPDRGLGPSVTHSWAAQPECERSAAMVRRTWGQYVAVCPRLQLSSHTQPTSTLSRIKSERYIFIKKRVRSFIEAVLIVDYVSACFCLYMYTRSIQQNSKCWLCGDKDETINHIISECGKLAQKEYTTRHDWVGKVIHWELCEKFEFNHTNKCYMHNPEFVLENEVHKIH